MKFFKKHKGAIVIYLIIIISTVVLTEDARRDELREESKYVMTYMPN